jgi:PAS domain S-box-containing protein
MKGTARGMAEDYIGASGAREVPAGDAVGSEFAGMGLDEVVASMAQVVVVVEAGLRRIVYSNAAAHRIGEQQLRRRILPGLADNWEIYHRDGRPYGAEEWPLVRAISAGEVVVDEEYFNICADGSRLIVRCSSWPVYGEDGEIAAGVLVMSDITKEHQAEEQIAYHARLADIVDDAVVGTDADFRVTVWNPGAQRLYGYAASEVLGRDARDVASYTGDTSRLELESDLLARDRSRRKITACRNDGTAIAVELVVVEVRGDFGEIIGYLGIHRDVTVRTQSEQASDASPRLIETILHSISAFLHLRRS